jgi:pimeloyl-ACP methyl ester carboxylesterase
MPDAILNGFKHHWEEAGSGDAVVMLHGASGSGVSLMNHMPEMSKTFRVLIPDMRGKGQSEHVASIPPSAWVDDVLALLDHLGIERAHVYGNSLGARVALRFGIDHPDRTLTLLLENPVMLNESAGNDALNERFAHPENVDERTAADWERQHGSEWQTVIRNYYSIRNDDAVQAHYDLSELSKQVTLPTLLMRGNAREQIHPIPHAVQLFENIKTAQLWIDPRGGGLANPEGYERVRAFVAAAAREPAAAR